MKKIIIVCLIAVMIMSLCACNMALGFGNYSFKHIYIDTYHHDGCYTVESWHDNETGIEVRTKEIGSIYCSEGTYVLIEDEDACPFCHEEG
jgi:hypothetical protein